MPRTARIVYPDAPHHITQREKQTVPILIILLVTVVTCRAGGCTKSLADSQPKRADANSVETILEQLSEETSKLKSYQCRIEYLFSQPLFESETLRKGDLYYQKAGDKSKLRINFKTLKQDDERQQKYIEQYIFDGTWLTVIDYQIKEVKRYQQAEPNEPADAFCLASRNFPIIGFSKAEDLKEQFEIKLVEQVESKPADFIQLHLKPKPDSIYKDDYTSIDFWIDKKLGLPAKIVAVSTEDDIYQIKLLKPKVNKKLGKKVFDFKVPKGFGVEITPLKKKAK